MSSIEFPQPSLKVIRLGVIISAMLYGGVATLALTYIPLLLKTSQTISRRMRNFLLAYVTFMVTASTIYTITLIIAFTIGQNILDNGPFQFPGDWFNPLIFPNGFAGTLCLAFTSWGADGFMVSSGLLYQRLAVADHFVFSASYGGVRCCMKEFRDLGGWQP